jgi:hypothetical protein
MGDLVNKALLKYLVFIYFPSFILGMNPLGDTNVANGFTVI